MQIEDKIIPAFRALVAKESYNKIPVSEICKAADISRKTFYSHYLDKQDLLERVFYIDIIVPIKELRKILPTERIKSAPQLLTETIHRTILDNRQFYRGLFGYAGVDGSIDRDISMILLTKQITQINLKVLHLDGYSETEREYRAYFFAAAHVALIAKWVKDDMALSPERLAQIFLKCANAAFNEINPPQKTW